MSHGRQPDAARPYILIVEDSLTQAALLRDILESAHYEVALASNGVDALDLLALRRPALIISDVTMPVMDGYALCKRLKASVELRTIPFMLLTVLNQPQDIFEGLGSGADFYSVKPYQADALLERVNTILRERPESEPAGASARLEVAYGGQRYVLNTGRNQILDLLLTTFEGIMRQKNQLVEINQQLSEALRANQALRGLIPICGYCKKIRDDRGYWEQVESFIAKNSNAQFTHGICPECSVKMVNEIELLNPEPAPEDFQL